MNRGKGVHEKSKASSERFFPLGVKLVSIVSLLLILSLGGMTVLASDLFKKDVEQTVKANTLDRAGLLSSKIENDLGGYINIGKLIAASLEGGLVYQGTGEGVASQLLSQQPDFLFALLLGKRKGSVEVLGRSVDEARLAALEIALPASIFEEAGEAGIVASAFAGVPAVANASPELKYPALALAFPYEMKGGGEAGTVVLLGFTMDKVIESLGSRELYRYFIVDASGTLVADADQKLDLARPSLRGDAIVRASITGVPKTMQLQYSDSGGRRYLGSYQRFFEGRLAVVSTVRADLALASVYLIQKRDFLITGIILCVSMLLLFAFSKTITIPVKRLVAGANRVAEGDYAVVVPPTTRDEIGMLSKAFNHMGKGLADREKLKTVFGKFVNKEVAERAMSGDIQLGGELRTAAIFFSDIRSFTAISERLNPHEIVEFLNDYMTRMVACVNRTHGLVDKFIGDSIMAVWGLPASRGNDTENAIDGALLMRRALAEFNEGRGGDRKPIIKAGSGINTGEIIAGQIGSVERMEYTCIGDAVNLASRIEGLCKPFKTDILVSQESYELVRGIYRTAPMRKIMVKGKAEPQQVYAVLGRLDDPASPRDIAELRAWLGWDSPDLDAVDVDGHENKYSFIK
jgi:adenylate cyclase